MKNRVKILTLSLSALLLLSGCAPKSPKAPKEKKRPKRVLWNERFGADRNYNFKPEPFSLDSKQNDPELLGPQSTLKKSLTSTEANLNDSSKTEVPNNLDDPDLAEGFLAKNNGSSNKKPSTSHQPMTKSRCIELIGQSDFDKYTKQFGSQKAALRKCTILERVQKR